VSVTGVDTHLRGGSLPPAVTDDYDALVYDLDGTLVRLDVDWDAVAGDAASALADRGIDTAGRDLWDLLERAEADGHRPVVEGVIADHERAGARTSERLALAAELPVGVPTAVCSLNCETACHIALERHEIGRHVDAVVGRDTVEGHKPDPEPLLAAVDRLGADPGRALFVGDSERDEVAARAAGVEFQYVSDRRSG
jgi:phosphoglycolate phosphatase